MTTELEELRKDIREFLPARDAKTLIDSLDQMDTHLRRLEQQVKTERSRADAAIRKAKDLQLPEGTEVHYGGAIALIGKDGMVQKRGSTSWTDIVGATMARDNGVGGTVVFQ